LIGSHFRERQAHAHAGMRVDDIRFCLNVVIFARESEHERCPNRKGCHRVHVAAARSQIGSTAAEARARAQLQHVCRCGHRKSNTFSPVASPKRIVSARRRLSRRTNKEILLFQKQAPADLKDLFFRAAQHKRTQIRKGILLSRFSNLLGK